MVKSTTKKYFKKLIVFIPMFFFSVAVRKRHRKIYDDLTVNNCIGKCLRCAKDRKGGSDKRRKIAEKE